MSFAADTNSSSSDAPVKTGAIVEQVSKKNRRISRDEMNLAEFPLAVLSTRVNPNLKTLEFSDSIRDKNGKEVKRNWVITGADKFGLPTSSDDEVLLGLLKLTVDEGLDSQKVYFTRYELLKILRWSTEGRSYTRLQNAFDRLTGVRVKATNAFYDNESKKHSTKNFGIVDAYEINDGRESDTKPSYFIWSEELLKSFQAGYVKKLDLDFYLDLKSAVSKRLYRFLDKLFWYKVEVSFDLFTLCHEKLGISRNYKYASSLKQQLDPALQELYEKGFLSGSSYEGRGKGTEVTFFAGRQKPRSLESKEDSAVGTQVALSLQAAPEPGATASATSAKAAPAQNLQGMLAKALQERGIAARAVAAVLKDQSEEVLKRIALIVKHYDQLVAEGSSRISKNREGFLYWAITNPEKYQLPQDAASKSKKAPTPAVQNPKSVAPEPAEKQLNETLYKEYLDCRTQEVVKLLHNVEESMLDSIRQEAEKEFAPLRRAISQSRYEEAVNRSVEERLAKLFKLPNFQEWCAEQS